MDVDPWLAFVTPRPRRPQPTEAAATVARTGQAFREYRIQPDEISKTSAQPQHFKLFDHPAFGGALHAASVNPFKVLSAINLIENEAELDALSEAEQTFVDEIERQNLYLTHATSARNIEQMKDIAGNL